MNYLLSIWEMTLDAAPWLLFGFLAAAVVRAWVPTAFVSRQLGGRSVGSVLKASVIGIPLPLCSCGVLPTALGLRRQGASRPATVSFLVSTPEIGLDSFMLSYALLGPFLAITRPIAALVSSVTAGLMALMIGEADEEAGRRAADASATGGCCGSAKPQAAEAGCCSGAKPQAAESCCDSAEPQAAEGGCCGSAKPQAAGERTGAVARLVEGVRYVFTRLLDDIKWWMAAALIIAGVMMAFTGGQPAAVLEQWGRGPLAMLVMLLVGVPLYVCATSSTPIAAALLVAGVSPGAVVVLLLAGPATNIGSVAILRRELGTKTVIVYLLAIAVCAVGAGLIVNWLVGAMGISTVAQAEHAGHLIPHGVKVAAAVFLIAMAIPPVRRFVLRMPRPESRPASGGSADRADAVPSASCH